MSYSLSDWKGGISPPKGWDCADAFADGWTDADVRAFFKASLVDWSPGCLAPPPAGSASPPPPAPPFPGVPPSKAKPGAAGVEAMGAFTGGLNTGSEVEMARKLSEIVPALCGGMVASADGAFWAWGPTDWQKIPDRDMRISVHNFEGCTMSGKNTSMKVGKRIVDGTLSELSTILSKPGFFDHPTVALNAENTVITLDPTGKVGTRPHDPDDKFRFTIPAEFHLHTDMQLVEGTLLHKLLTGAFRDDPDADAKIALMGEILGSAAFGMATMVKQPKAFIFLGESANNGKSTIASLLACLLPDGSVSSIAPAAFADAARIVNLAGKAANVADEISGAVAGEAFKAAITGNPIEGRDLYRSAVTFRPRAIHVFTTNRLPTFHGGLDRGLQRRLVVLHFTRTIPDKEAIPDIVDRIRRDELDLLLGFAIAGAIRLVRSGAYTIPASSLEALRGWLMLDPVVEWFEARCTISEVEPRGGWSRTRDLYADFKAWCIDEGHTERTIPPVNTFSQRLKSMPGVRIKRSAAWTLASGVICKFSAVF